MKGYNSLRNVCLFQVRVRDFDRDSQPKLDEFGKAWIGQSTPKVQMIFNEGICFNLKS